MMGQNNLKILPRVAYFCMEYGLHEELMLYSGGLGILAGDYLKCAGRKKVPLVGIGILWRQGYTHQLICGEGKPYDVFRDLDLDIIKDTGSKISVRVGEEDVFCKIWLVDRYGNAPLYLLDTNLPENSQRGRDITCRLYWGPDHDRVAQEMILGIGGVRALRALGYKADIYHFNEGHAILGAVELVREKMERGIPFEKAWQETRQQVIFTTHTPVSAGNGSYCHGLLSHLGAYNGLSYEQVARLGGDPFNVTVAGLRLARVTNAVSQIHSQTAQDMWKHVDNASPIISITNGVDPYTWQDPRLREGAKRGDCPWASHQAAKKELLETIKGRNGVSLEPDKLLVGFARRVTAYKRCDLIFQKPHILEPLLEQKLVQLVFSGKVHPHDHEGKQVIPGIITMQKKYPGQVVFLENYDMEVGKKLTRGCDVWLNNPRRPLEACGTSGMKAAMNGVLNLSVPDGWWPEACRHGVNGWQIGSLHQEYQGCQDEKDLQDLFQVLTEEVIPLYYQDQKRWIEMMKNSIKTSCQDFSADRMLEDYFNRLYLKGGNLSEKVFDTGNKQCYITHRKAGKA